MAEETKSLQNLQSLLDAMDKDRLGKKDFTSAFSKVLELVLQMQKNQQSAISKLQETYAVLLKTMQDKHDAGLSDLKGQVDGVFVSKAVEKMMKEHEVRMSEMMAKMKAVDSKMATIRSGKDGYIPKKGRDYFDGKDAVLPATMVKDMAYLLEKDKKGQPAQPTKFLGGVLNVGARVEVPEGAVNGENRTFIVFNIPKWIVVDGATYFENSGYTLTGNASGKTVTTDVAPAGAINSIY